MKHAWEDRTPDGFGEKTKILHAKCLTDVSAHAVICDDRRGGFVGLKFTFRNRKGTNYYLGINPQFCLAIDAISGN